MPTVAILGGGSFGTALANIAAEKGSQVVQWLRDEAMVDLINTTHRNDKYLPDVLLNPLIRATTQLEEAVTGVDIVFEAVPSSACRSVAAALRTALPRPVPVVSCTKGIEADGFRLMSQVLAEELPESPIGVLSGPNLAREIARRSLTATVIASHHEGVVKAVQDCLNCEYFRVYASDDVYGVELGGALKNIYAIAAGMAHAMGMGDNTRSMLITRALAEMCRLAYHLGADPMTFLGLAGVGDLVATCTSEQSRNFRVGVALGKGKSVEQALDGMDQVAEGVNTIRVVREKALAEGVYMPIVDGLYRILFANEGIPDVLGSVMASPRGFDVEFVARPREY